MASAEKDGFKIGGLSGLESTTRISYVASWVRVIFTCIQLQREKKVDLIGRSFDLELTMQQALVVSSIEDTLEMEIRQDDASRTQTLDDAVYHLSYLLIATQLSSNPLNSPLYRICAVLSVAQDGTFVDIRNYSQSLSAIIYNARLLWVTYLVRQHGPHTEWHDLLELLEEARAEQICETSDYPLARLIDIRGFAMGLTKNLPGKAIFSWNASRSELTRTGNLVIAMDTIRQMFKIETDRLLGELHELFMGLLPSLPSDHLDQAKHDIYSTVDGQNFVTANPTLYPPTFLLKLLLQDEDLTKQWYNINTSELNINRARAYLTQVVKLFALLAPLVHMLGGPMSRGTELLAVRRFNCAYGPADFRIWSNHVRAGQNTYVASLTELLSTAAQHHFLQQDAK